MGLYLFYSNSCKECLLIEIITGEMVSIKLIDHSFACRVTLTNRTVAPKTIAKAGLYRTSNYSDQYCSENDCGEL